jgi:hypothetical protein
MFAIMSPENLLLVVKEAQQTSSPQRYIDEKLSSQARRMVSYMEEMVSVAEAEVFETTRQRDEIEAKIQTLQQNLVQAYEEIEFLQAEFESDEGLPGGNDRNTKSWPLK